MDLLRRKRLTSNEYLVRPYSFSADGKRLLYTELSPRTGSDIWVLPIEGSDSDHPRVGKPEVFLRTDAHEADPAFSPDGRWVAYTSNESGEVEVYVRPFLGPESKSRISVSGGLLPVWSRAKQELVYETLDGRLMLISYTVNGATFTAGKPRLWSSKQIFYDGLPNMDLSPDGKRFAVLMTPDAPAGQRSAPSVTFLVNFFDELRRRVSTGK